MSELKPGIGKLYYSIGEVAEVTGLPPYTLRSWEKEFPCLRPKRVRGKNRAYRPRDIGIILLIKRLLQEERYSMEGARRKLRSEPELVQKAADGFPAKPRGLRPSEEAGETGQAAPQRDPRSEEAGLGDLPGGILGELRRIARLLE